jgi:DNA-3-methyladenine glycosylase II
LPTPHTLSPKTIAYAEAHLARISKIMARLISSYGPCDLGRRRFRPFDTLVNSIISQQLTAKAAHTIRGRLLTQVSELSPAAFLALPLESFRHSGVSHAKARYIIELSNRTSDGRLDLTDLLQRPNEEVIETLVQLPGIGRWTAEMFLIFALRRPDVLSLGDAGLQRAARLLYGNRASLESIAKAWTPYRSVASWYLWRHLD